MLMIYITIFLAIIAVNQLDEIINKFIIRSDQMECEHEWKYYAVIDLSKGIIRICNNCKKEEKTVWVEVVK